MPKTIKLFKAIRVTIDGESTEVENFPDLWKVLNMDGAEYEECRLELIRHMMCFGHIDLTEAYRYIHSVVLDVIPCDKEG